MSAAKGMRTTRLTYASASPLDERRATTWRSRGRRDGGPSIVPAGARSGLAASKLLQIGHDALGRVGRGARGEHHLGGEELRVHSRPPLLVEVGDRLEVGRLL